MTAATSPGSSTKKEGFSTPYSTTSVPSPHTPTQPPYVRIPTARYTVCVPNAPHFLLGPHVLPRIRVQLKHDRLYHGRLEQPARRAWRRRPRCRGRCPARREQDIPRRGRHAVHARCAVRDRCCVEGFPQRRCVHIGRSESFLARADLARRFGLVRGIGSLIVAFPAFWAVGFYGRNRRIGMYS